MRGISVRAALLPALLVGIIGCANNAVSHGSKASGSARTEPSQAAQTALDLRVDPFADFYFQARALAAGVVKDDPVLRPVADAYLPVQAEIGSFGGFWRFDLAGMLSSSPDEFASQFTDYPETIPSRAGGTIPIKGAGLAMAEAMESAWPDFLKQRWPQRQCKLMQTIEHLLTGFMPKHQQALQYMLTSLGIEDPQIRVPTYLVLETHPPGASTYRSSSGPVAVLSINDLLDGGRFSDLEETLLHETCHALDAASDGKTDAFSRLREMLQARGIDSSDPRYHDVPHLVMFAQAENTMRRLYDPNHVGYGDTRRGDIAPLYERSGAAANIVRKHWSDYLDGKTEREAALQLIADDVTAL